MGGGNVSPAITAHYHKAGGSDFTPHERNHIPHLAILEIMEEPKKHVVEPLSCAMRGRNVDNPSDRTAGIPTEQRLEIGSEIANCLTSVQKDSMIVEPCILGYTRDDKGNVTSRHEKEIAGTLHASTGSGGNTDQFVKEQVIGSMQANAMRGSIDGVSPCLTEAMGMGGGQIPMITKFPKQQYEQTNKRRVYSISDETDTREILSILWKEVGEKAIQKFARGFDKIFSEEILRHKLYEESLCQERTQSAKVETRSCLGSEDSIPNRESSESLRDLRLNTKCGYTPQGWQPSEQYLRELDACLSELSHEATQTHECVQNLRQSLQNNPWYVRQALSQMEEIWRPPSEAVEYLPKARYRIRKLTPKEAFRLMDVSDSDIDKIEAHRIKVTLKNGTVKEKPIPKSAKYKLAGNSIVVSCLYHIFHQMFIAEPPEPKPIQKSLFD